MIQIATNVLTAMTAIISFSRDRLKLGAMMPQITAKISAMV
jgi:hypothetical protein